MQEPGFDSGTTAVVSFLRWDEGKLRLWVANAGDSRLENLKAFLVTY
jgi:serine/threonine protein phosphatase PrpC